MAEGSIERVVTGGFGWKHAFVIIGLGIIGAAVYRRNVFGLSQMADRLVGVVDRVG